MSRITAAAEFVPLPERGAVSWRAPLALRERGVPETLLTRDEGAVLWQVSE